MRGYLWVSAGAFVVAGVFAAPSPVAAQVYPTRQIELVVPFVAGGTTAAWRPYQDLFQPGADGLAAHQGRDAAGARRLHRQRGGSEVSATGTGNIHQQCL